MRSFCAIVILAAPSCLAQNYPPLTVYAGTPLDSAFSGDGGQATNPTFANPWNVAVDTKGNLYIADDCNNRVRKGDPTGIITTVAGSGNSMGVCYMATGYPTVPAKAGDFVVIFGVGFGPTSPAVPAGQPFTGSSPATDTITLKINGQPVTPGFSGLSAPGLFQFNVTMLPSGLGTGDQPIVATVNGVSTQPNVVIALQ